MVKKQSEIKKVQESKTENEIEGKNQKSKPIIKSKTETKKNAMRQPQVQAKQLTSKESKNKRVLLAQFVSVEQNIQIVTCKLSNCVEGPESGREWRCFRSWQ